MQNTQKNIPLLKEALKKTGSVEVICTGTSMSPNIHQGELIPIRPVDTILSGDVVLFERPPGELVVHRFLFRIPNTPWFIHLGDAAPKAHLARYEDIIGVVDGLRKTVGAKAMVKAMEAIARGVKNKILKRF